jgi:hypothetical protein
MPIETPTSFVLFKGKSGYHFCMCKIKEQWKTGQRPLGSEFDICAKFKIIKAAKSLVTRFSQPESCRSLCCC